MNNIEILDIIDKNYAPLTFECKKELITNIKIRSFEKGEIIVREGQYADKVYFIVEGCGRAYYLKGEKDITDWFAFEHEFISSIVSFFGNKPSPHFVEMVEKSIVLEVSKESIEHLSNKYHDFEKLIRVVVTQVMLSQQERISSILFQTADQRYKQILSIHPDIINKFPLKHIASYLGMTLETLSRVRSGKH